MDNEILYADPAETGSAMELFSGLVTKAHERIFEGHQTRHKEHKRGCI